MCRVLIAHDFEQGRRLSLKCPCGFDQLRDVRPELIKRRELSASDFIPMPLVDSEQLDKEHHGVVLSQPMLIPPLGDRLVELFVEVGLFVARYGIIWRATRGRRRIRSRRKASVATFEGVAGQEG